MKKLVTALIVVLPLVLLVALFAVTGIVRISADIPATGISITNKGEDGVYFFDLANYTAPLYESDLGVEVLPSVASNKDYLLTITDANGNPTDVATRDEDGAFRLHTIGIAKLTYTSRDGGYTDSVLFNVTATGALDFTPILTDKGGNEFALENGDETDYKATITTGNYVLGGRYFPAAVQSADFTISAANNQIISLTDNNGGFIARFSGKTILTMTVKGAYRDVFKTIELNVQPAGDVIIDGMDAISNTVRLSAPLNVTSVAFGVQAQSAVSADNISVSGVGITADIRKADGLENAYNVTLNLASPYTSATSMRYTLTVDGKQYRFYVDFDNHNISIFAPSNPSGVGDIVILTDATVKLGASCTPSNPNVRYKFTVEEQDTIAILSEDGSTCTVRANTSGRTVLSVLWTQYDDNGNALSSGTETRTLIAVQGYSSLLFAEHADSYGLGGAFAIASAKYDENGKLVQNSYLSKFRAYGLSGNTAPISDITFVSSDNSIATVEQRDGNVYFIAHSTGTVTVTAEWKYGKAFGVQPATFTFCAVDGVEANSDESIRLAFAENKQVVLTDDIYLGENLFEKTANGGRTPKYGDAVMREKLLQYTDEIKTTADWQYYKNIGQEQPTVRYCLDITANIYGNGHTINAQYITDMLDSTDKPYEYAVFKGPLDFVATNTEGIKLASVKGQDNIVFLVRTDGVVIDNAVLKGCDDETLYENGAVNLSLLNTMGTTLEIMSDATITNSRVMNGRTVVRVFGRDSVDNNSPVNAQTEKISVTIDGCILQNAREFLLKTGTNRTVRGDAENPAPSLFDGDGNEYGAYNSSDCDRYVDDEYFMSQYVLTDVTLKDSTLRTSGLFTIGVESHFAGPMLADSKKTLFQLEGWNDLAGTSYPAILHLVGDVILADWKAISSVDSSTLIESNATQESLAFLSLNIAEMLKTVQQFGGEKYENLIANKNGEQYVHGGIAFYGGGKNYSILDTSKYTFKPMTHYTVNLSILQQSENNVVSSQGYMLPLAAGAYDFRFVLFDAVSEFDYSAQAQM